MDETRRCRAKNRAGERCKNAAIEGGTVCHMHGGKAPQVRAAAHRRILENLVTPALRELKALLDNPNTPANVKLGAARDILDRTGFKPPTEFTGTLTLQQIEQAIEMYEQMELDE